MPTRPGHSGNHHDLDTSGHQTADHGPFLSRSSGVGGEADGHCRCGVGASTAWGKSLLDAGDAGGPWGHEQSSSVFGARRRVCPTPPSPWRGHRRAGGVAGRHARGRCPGGAGRRGPARSGRAAAGSGAGRLAVAGRRRAGRHTAAPAGGDVPGGGGRQPDPLGPGHARRRLAGTAPGGAAWYVPPPGGRHGQHGRSASRSVHWRSPLPATSTMRTIDFSPFPRLRRSGVRVFCGRWWPICGCGDRVGAGTRHQVSSVVRSVLLDCLWLVGRVLYPLALTFRRLFAPRQRSKAERRGPPGK